MSGFLRAGKRRATPHQFCFRAGSFGPRAAVTPPTKETLRNDADALTRLTGMKPPQRRRAIPRRYLVGDWPRGLENSQRETAAVTTSAGATGPARLDAAELAQELPGRSKTESKSPEMGARLEAGARMCPGLQHRGGS